MHSHAPTHRAAPAWQIAAAGMAALATAMGIGRFAFTPLLPMMLADGSVDLATASWLASANYLGYLVGALACTLQPWLWQRLGVRAALNGPALVRVGLAATVVLTLAMALPWPGAWVLLRFLAGVASALVFVYTSGWCLTQLAARGHAAMGALIYTGPGAGIALTGLAAGAMVAAGWSAGGGWLFFGVLAAVLSGLVWKTVRSGDTLAAGPAQAAGASAGAAPTHGRPEVALLAVGYGLAGFGYIITATFLPVIARQALPGSAWLDLFWPIFGLAVVLGALVASRIQKPRDLRVLLAICYFVQAAGVASSLVAPSLAGFAIGSLLLGLPFTAITFFGMQEARRLRPHAVSSTMGLLTVLYGLGQIVGPPLAAAFVHAAASPAQGFSHALAVAAASLVVGAVLFLTVARRYPVRAA